MGVDTLELDMGVTNDGVIVVSHERGLNPDLARDAKGVYVPAPGIPYVTLTLAQVNAMTWVSSARAAPMPPISPISF